ncbi:hypothetical protein NWE55_01465 [Myroides albus]|uniref:DUF8202 domain-containing protein n=1 Tax=Myroides albus TaxID=2562892 RepID=A0A6I3LNC8_9FLAO|nr:hypothetical protein [Myroides albus]MTG99384.1 hypothetical protein [Myroides albus]UVD79987.1 hypothetical protein NWE55_01465 [Myroides albus]
MFKYIYRFLVLLLIFFNPSELLAQVDYPGGVYGVQVWLKPDHSIKMYGQTTQVDGWANASVALQRNANFSFSNLTGTNSNSKPQKRPSFVKGSYKMNFNSALVFDGAHFLASNTGVPTTGELTVFAVYIALKEAGSTRMYYVGFGGTDPRGSSTRKPPLGFSPEKKDAKGGGRTFGPGYIDGEGGYVKNTTALQTSLLKEKDYTKFRFNGADFSEDKKGKSLPGPTSTYFKTDGGMTLGGASIHDSGGGPMGGQLGELIVYNRILTASEINKIESYLGTKYGITLDGVAYTSSTGNVFWPFGRTGIGYHNNVAGIFRDDNNTSISVSRSTAAGAVLTVNTIGTEFEAGVGVIHEVELPDDNTAIYWGSNQDDGGVSVPINEPGCDFNFALKDKFWKFKKTGLPKTTVEVRAGGESFAYQGPGYEVRMLVAKTEADAYAGRWLAVIPGTYVGGELEEHLFNLPLDQDELYITFGAKPSPGFCVGCSTNIAGNYKFSSQTWKSGSKSVTNLKATNGIRFDVDFKTFSNGTENGSMQMSGYPRVSNGTLLESRFKGVKGSDDNSAVTTIRFKDGATFAKFNIYGIDKTTLIADEVEVIGYCGDIAYNAILSFNTKDPSKQTFTIGGRKANGTKRSSITNKNAAAIVEFPHEVNRIVIKHNLHYRTSSRGYQNIAIGDFEFNCPRPANPNPDGIEYTLQAPAKVVSCTDFLYTFKVWNYACEARYVKIDDELPEGMTWVNEGVTSSQFAFNEAKFNNYGGTRVLSIDKVRLSPGTFTTITARVRFDDNAVPKIYENRGKLTYESLNEGKEITIESCDYNNFTECVSTKVEMIHQDRVLSPKIKLIPVSRRCYKDKGIITVKASIENPNPSIDFTDLNFTFTYNDDFIFKSFSSNFGNGTEVKEDGIHIVEGLSINGGKTLELTYEVQALDFLALIEVATGNKYTKPRDVPDEDIAKVVEFGAQLELVGNSEDECINASLEDAYVNLDPTIPFCGRDLSCYYPPVSGQITKKNSDFVMMTTLDRSKGESISTSDINAWLYLESKTKGFVPTRLSEAQIGAIVDPVAGMLVYDTTNKCLKFYDGTKWACILQSCPDN